MLDIRYCINYLYLSSKITYAKMLINTKIARSVVALATYPQYPQRFPSSASSTAATRPRMMRGAATITQYRDPGLSRASLQHT